ncbi:MAG: beta-N-acetylglucosaminidase domain-containing protein [Verrucomicrobiales bacterium]|nr:beta-N-acetylglucosaminidase domain-containing protein [Verrucomicrobiales bacterium]
MPKSEANGFLAGVIEGFYGPPWAVSERHQLFEWMAAWGLGTYFYCLKDDPKNRSVWRECYTEAEATGLGERIRECRSFGVRFVYGLSPGLDIRYSSASDAECLRRRFGRLLELGCRDFALLFDDIPDAMDPADVARWGTLASAQCGTANDLFAWTRERCPEASFLFCPTPYCSRMLAAGLGGPNYLETLGRELHSDIDVLWTGPEIVSAEIPLEHVEAVGAVLRRKPVLWDNLHANDYDGRRFYAGPYSGRPSSLKGAVRGILVNPNCELPLNYVPLRTFADYLSSGDSWDPRTSYLAAIEAWSKEFGWSSRPVSAEELAFFCDCFYLPFSEGATASALFEAVRRLLERHPSDWGNGAVEVRRELGRLRDICVRLADVGNRPLFHALYRRVWELREECDLLDRYVDRRGREPGSEPLFVSDYHLPGTYRGGMVAKLQRLLVQEPDGRFRPASLRP